MLTRYTITLGAPTTAGGKVSSASDFRTIDGLGVALEGDTCWCPHCQSEGIIRPDGPRLSDTVDGREVALDGDLCICACSPPPRLLAAQTLRSQTVDGEQFAEAVTAALGAAATSNAAALRPDAADHLPLALLDPDTGEPLRHRPYRLELGKETITGTLDANGRTRPLSAAERAAVLSWHVQDA